MRNENKIYHTFKSWVKRDGFLHVFEDFIFHRIETGTTELGVPDIYFENKYFTGWIEQKYITLPKRSSTNIKIKWEPLQISWGYRHTRFVNTNVSKYALAVIDDLNVIRIFKWPFIGEEYTQEMFKEKGVIVNNIIELFKALKE